MLLLYIPVLNESFCEDHYRCLFQDGQIDAEELQRCLTASGIGGTYQPFSKDTCRIMIAMLDRDRSGKMGFNEFKELWGALNQWKVCVCV